MPNFKELVVVLFISTIAFIWLKPIALRFTAESDFARRRNLWLVLTCIGFLSPNIWVYALLAGPLMLWGGRRDSNPIALYLVLLHVIPPVSIPIPFPGINVLFEFQNYRLLAFCILIPTIWRIRKDSNAAEGRGWQGMDLLLLGLGVLQTVLFIRPDIPTAYLLHDSTTNLLRRLFLFLIDIYALYYAVSRSCASKARIVDAMAAYCVVCGVMALEAVFESLRHWLLYQSMALNLNPENYGVQLAYLLRNGVLRAQAAAGYSLALGYLLAVAFGFWLYLQPHIETRLRAKSLLVVLWAGLIAAYSRGPWIGAVAIYFITIALDPKAFGRLGRAAALVIVLSGVIALTPLGYRISSVLPFLGGSVDVGNLEYRQRLASTSWNLIMNHPYFGDGDFMSKMKDLRQGQGIIDLVNTYAGTALEYGLVGLALFVGFILLGMFKAFRAMIRIRDSDGDLARLGSCILACIAGTLLMIYNCSLVFGYEKMFYVLAGLAAAYCRLCGAQAAATTAKEFPLQDSNMAAPQALRLPPAEV
jgi:O-antigen ligase